VYFLQAAGDEPGPDAFEGAERDAELLRQLLAGDQLLAARGEADAGLAEEVDKLLAVNDDG
jgi:hypothetical protein